MSKKPEAKTYRQLERERETILNTTYMLGLADFDSKKWVSEAEHKKQMDEFGRQNEALAVVCADLKERLEAIRSYYNTKMPYLKWWKELGVLLQESKSEGKK